MIKSKRDALSALREVSPGEAFYVCDGTYVGRLVDLPVVLKGMDRVIYGFHANKERNDFADWVEHVFSDSVLAKALRGSSKAKAVSEVNKRLKWLEKKSK